MPASRPRLAVLRCAVVVCCHPANRPALAVRENERNIAHYIMDFHNYTIIYRGHGAKNVAIAHRCPGVTNEIEQNVHYV